MPNEYGRVPEGLPALGLRFSGFGSSISKAHTQKDQGSHFSVCVRTIVESTLGLG